jgi:hypothetical protein
MKKSSKFKVQGSRFVVQGSKFKVRGWGKAHHELFVIYGWA